VRDTSVTCDAPCSAIANMRTSRIVLSAGRAAGVADSPVMSSAITSARRPWSPAGS
jgi:hypothetical protein